MDRETVRETWTKRVDRWRQSGLTYAAFSREHGLNEKSLRWWRIRLDNEARAGGTPETAKAPKASVARPPKAPSAVTFIEVTPKVVAAGAIEIVVPSGIVRVTPDFDSTTLGRVLDVLKERA